MTDFNSRIIDEFRANNGHVVTAGFGSDLVLLHTTGARTGASRISPLMSIPTDDGWLVAASKGGAPDEPAWAHNLRKHPDILVETGAGEIAATAHELHGAEHTAGWERFTTHSPAFAGYQEKTTRQIAVFHLVRSAA